jgi:hypothetical protein
MLSTTASAGRTELTEERALIPPSVDDRLIGDASVNSAAKCRHPGKPPAQIALFDVLSREAPSARLGLLPFQRERLNCAPVYIAATAAAGLVRQTLFC